jgi:two-component system, cell cycle sensor histidine kinase and response regulator CckA
VAEILKLLRASLPATINLNHALTHTSPILADATQIHQVVMNLATNAFHALEATGGSLDISLTDVCLDHPLPAVQGELAPGAYVVLEVKDTGPGIPPEILPRIFEPYFTTKGVGKGTGLGLATVLGIVKTHGGEIVVASEPGTGTAFTVYFPAIPSAQPTTRSPENFPCQSGHGRLLFVDDEPVLAKLGKALLSRLGYDVTALTDSPEALQIFRSHPEAFDLVVTDLTMPQLTGLDLAREIQTIRPGIPIILYTGYTERLSQEFPRELGIRKIFLKPLEITGLARTIKELLAAKA